MHELLLHASLPLSRQPRVLAILAGLAAMQPVPLREQIQLYKPNRLQEASRSVQVGAVQGVNVPKSQAAQMQAAMAGDLFYLRVMTEMETSAKTVDAEDNGKAIASEIIDGPDEKKDEMEVDLEHDSKKKRPSQPSQTTKTTTLNPQNSKPKPPILQFRDLPEPKHQKDRITVTSRLIADIPITSGSSSAFLSALDYSLVSTYYTEGHRLSYNNINVHVYRVLLPSSPHSSSVPSADSNPTNEAKMLAATVNGEDMQLLDKSGAYIVQASVRVQDGSKVETVARGTSELLALREMLRGVLDLEAVERLALDTRVR